MIARRVVTSARYGLPPLCPKIAALAAGPLDFALQICKIACEVELPIATRSGKHIEVLMCRPTGVSALLVWR